MIAPLSGPITAAWQILGVACRAGVWGGYSVLQGVHFAVYASEVIAGPGHPGVLGPDEAGVGGYGLAHLLHETVQLGLKLAPHDLSEPPAERVRLLAEVLAGLAPPVWEDEETVARDDGRRYDPGGVEKTGGRQGDDEGPDAARARLYGGRGGGRGVGGGRGA